MSDALILSITSKDQAIMRKLKLLQSKGELLGEELMSDIGKMTAEYAEGPVFMSEGGVLGARWQSLSDKYASWKLKHSNLNNLLVFSGKMKDSFAWTAHADYVEVGNNAPYFAYHQSSAARKSNLPRRQMIGFDDTLKNKIQSRMRQTIRGKLA